MVGIRDNIPAYRVKGISKCCLFRKTREEPPGGDFERLGVREPDRALSQRRARLRVSQTAIDRKKKPALAIRLLPPVERASVAATPLMGQGRGAPGSFFTTSCQ
jgi:hypothetical protein